MRIEADATPLVRKSDGKTELLVPVAARRRQGAKIVQEFAW